MNTAIASHILYSVGKLGMQNNCWWRPCTWGNLNNTKLIMLTDHNTSPLGIQNQCKFTSSGSINSDLTCLQVLIASCQSVTSAVTMAMPYTVYTTQEMALQKYDYMQQI